MQPGLGQGVYSAREASDLTGVSARRIRRWFEGYEYISKAKRHRMPPVVAAHGREFDGQLQVSFLDMIEIRLIEKFLTFGVGWTELRLAAKAGAEMLKTEHPFASMKFRTDGRRIFADIKHGGSTQLTQLRDRQQVFRSVIEPALKGVDFDGQQAVRWWPMGQAHRILVDPLVCFGKPVGARSGVPVAVLAGHAKRNGVKATARWYGVEPTEVGDALTFARRIAA